MIDAHAFLLSSYLAPPTLIRQLHMQTVPALKAEERFRERKGTEIAEGKESWSQ
jgi:hypothetical protein